MPTQIKIDTNAEAIMARLRAAPPRMVAAIASALDLQNQLSVGIIDRERLSQRGPTTLGVVTNRLRGSIRASKAVANGTAITSAIGSNVVYAAVHEYGIDAMVTVREHTRKNPHAGKPGSAAVVTLDRKGHIIRRAARPPAPATVTIRAHQMHMKLPARAYIRGVLEQRAPQYSLAISDAIRATWEGAN